MRRCWRIAALGLLLLPALAFADEAGPAVLSLKSGVPAELLGKTLGIARGLFALSLVVALLVEAFSSSPTQQKNYGGVAWRALLVLALLSGYRVLFGTVITTCQSIADRIAPQSIYTAFGEHNIRSIEELRQRTAQEDAKNPPTGFLDGLTSSGKLVRGYVGGALFDGLVLVLVSLGHACYWAFIQLSRVLVTVLYILGPLALVFHIPAPSDVARRWFRNFITVASWPVFSALLLAIATSLLMRTDSAAVLGHYSTAFGGLATTLLMVAMSLATPVLASAAIGGSLKNLPMMALAAATFGLNAALRAIPQEPRQAPPSPPPPGSPRPPSEGITSGAPAPSEASGAHPIPGQPIPVPLSAAFRGAEPPAPAAEAAAPAEGAGVPAHVAVPVPGGDADATAVGGPGFRKGPGSFAGAWKLPRVGGRDTDDMRVRPTAPDATPEFAEPTAAIPKNFNPVDWDDVGS
jgi:hypothetical protein